MPWSTSDMRPGEQSLWLARLYEKTVTGIRTLGLPKAVEEKALRVRIPTLADQARAMRMARDFPPGENKPSGIIQFLE